MAKNPVYSEYTKYYARLMRRAKSMEKRGYTFKKSAIPKKVKHPKAASVEKVKEAIKNIYKNAYGYINDKKVSGEEYRKYERSQAAKKGAETKKRKQETPPPNLGALIIQRLRNTIADLRNTEANESADRLESVLDEQIRSYGEETLAKSLVDFEEEITDCCDVLMRYRSGSAQHQAVLIRLEIILTGVVPDAESMRKMSEAYEADEDFTDTDIDFDELPLE